MSIKKKCDNCLIGMRWAYESEAIYADDVKIARGYVRLALEGYKDKFNTYELFESCPRCSNPIDREAIRKALLPN